MAVVHYKKQYKKKKIIIVIKKNLGTLKFGYYGIKSLQSGILDINQLETIRRIITKLTKRYSKIYIRVYFHHPVTIKPLLTRMGKGVGNIKFWICYIKKGIIFIEIANVDIKLVTTIFKTLSNRLPIKINLLIREVLWCKVIA